MHWELQLRKYREMDRLLRTHATGDKDELMRKLDISQGQIYNMLNWFKACGAKIRWESLCNSWVYLNDFEGFQGEIVIRCDGRVVKRL